MKNYISINLPFKHRFVFQKNNYGSYQINFFKKNPLPEIGREALEWLDRSLTNDQEKVRELIDPLYYRGSYSKDDVIVKVVENMIKVADTSPAEDISEPMKPIILTKEERQRIDEVLKKADKVLFDLKGDEFGVTKQMYNL